jgi:hypothetical protein
MVKTGFTPQVTQAGDPNISYVNVEFTRDNQCMVWFEPLTADETASSAC